MKKKIYSSELIWDTTKSYAYYPKIIKDQYSKIFYENFKEFNLWIDRLSRKNSENYNWWLTRFASRDERISSIFHNIVVYVSLTKIIKSKTKIKLITNSEGLKFLLEKKNYDNIEIELKNYNSIFKKTFIFFKEFFILTTNIILVKLLFKFKKDKKKLNLVDYFEINQSQQIKRYFGNFITGKKNNYFYVPTFLSYSPKNIISHLNNKNILLREYFIELKDICSIIKNIISKKFKLNYKFKGINFHTLINEEFKFDNNLRSIIIAYQNYIFFKNLKKRGFEINNVISWNENQIIDKGWSLGINNFYNSVNYIGYNGSTLHPQFFNLSPTKSEFISGAIPKKILIISKSYLKNRNLFFKGIKFKVTKNNRFRFNFKTKKKYILFLLSGIKESDQVLIDFFDKLKRIGYNNLKIKFHPILPSNSFNKNFVDEIRGDGSQIIKSSYIVVTTSYTSGLYESISNNSYTILLETSALDRNLFKYLKNYSRKIQLSSDFDQLSLQIKKINKKPNLNYKVNKTLIKRFFNK